MLGETKVVAILVVYSRGIREDSSHGAPNRLPQRALDR